MTLRAVIESLLRGSDDAEAALADNGFGDLPADMFGQALASYSDTAPMAEADALTPVLASLEASDPSDVFAVLEEQPLGMTSEASPADLAMVGAAVGGVEAVDEVLDNEPSGDDLGDVLDDFGVPTADQTTDDVSEETADTLVDDALVDGALVDDTGPGLGVEDADPFADDGFASGDSETETFEELFETEPEATGDDPSDLDLDF